MGGSTKFQLLTALFFSSVAFCFGSRSMELAGGIIMLFSQVMAL